MRKLLLGFILLYGLNITQAIAINWIQRASLPAAGRQCSAGFAIGGYGYIGLGRNVATNTLFKDFWQYNPSNDSWTQMADFGGTARYAPSFFVIGDFGYVGLGADAYVSGYHFTNDFWKYDPLTNTWTQVASFGGSARYNAPAFAINSKGYVGTGYNQASPTFQDFWEYNSSTDTWTPKSNYPGGYTEAGVGFAIGNFGYMGVGWNGSAKSDFYKYDPTADSWTQIASYPYTLTSGTGFVIGGTAYVGLGSVSYPAINFKKQWWTYDPVSNAWSAFADLGTVGRYNSVSFAIGEIGYAGMGGITDWSHETNEFWSWDGVGINDLETNHFASKIYPNPSNGNIFVEADANGKITVSVYNYIAQCVHEVCIENYVSNQRILLNIENLPKGVYFVDIRSKNATSAGKIVLN